MVTKSACLVHIHIGSYICLLFWFTFTNLHIWYAHSNPLVWFYAQVHSQYILYGVSCVYHVSKCMVDVMFSIWLQGVCHSVYRYRQGSGFEPGVPAGVRAMVLRGALAIRELFYTEG